MEPAFKQAGKDTIISAKIKPNSSRFRVSLNKGQILIETTCPPEKGKANQEIVKKLGKLFNCEVRMVRGLSSKRKSIVLKNINSEEIRKTLKQQGIT